VIMSRRMRMVIMRDSTMVISCRAVIVVIIIYHISFRCWFIQL
jgi:hypothetical protein